jgi:predicted Zn-dependent peptidase
MICSDKLSNGIEVISEQISHVRSVALGIWLKKGARNEDAVFSGITHFLEHLFFKGTHQRNAVELARTIDSIGGQLDGMTGKEYICLYARVMDEHLPLAFDLLSDIVQNPLFKEADIKKERKVILEEIKMVEDTPDEYIHDLFISSFWPNHPLGRPILGTRKIISHLNRNDIVHYFKKCVVPENIMISAAGHLRHDEVMKLAEQYFSTLKGTNGLPDNLPPEHNSSLKLIKKKGLKQTHMCLGAASYPINHPDRYVCNVLTVLLGGGISSRLFQDIRENRGLAYSVYSYLNLYSDAGYLATYVGTSKKNLKTAVKLIIKHLRDIIEGKVEPSELNLVKEHLKGQLMLSLESTATRMIKLAQQILYFQRNFTLDEIIQGIEAVQLKDIKRVALELFAGKQLALTVIGDIKNNLISPQYLIP